MIQNAVQMKRVFTIEMSDSTSIEAIVTIELQTEDEDCKAQDQICHLRMADLFEPIEQVLIDILDDEEDENDDIAQLLRKRAANK